MSNSITPGPYSLDDTGGELSIVRHEDGELVTNLAFCSREDATMFVAAPELLASLKELEEYMTACGYFVKQKAMAKRVRSALRKAII